MSPICPMSEVNDNIRLKLLIEKVNDAYEEYTRLPEADIQAANVAIMHSVLKLNQDDVKKVVHKNLGRKQPTDYSLMLGHFCHERLINLTKIAPSEVKEAVQDPNNKELVEQLKKNSFTKRIQAIHPSSYIAKEYKNDLKGLQKAIDDMYVKYKTNILIGYCTKTETIATFPSGTMHNSVGSANALSFVEKKLNADLSFILWNKLPNSAPYTGKWKSPKVHITTILLLT
ncbi:hypothetical protein BDF20DRAFT_873470 [Mycotypha africana]|uniref:uncharacterized protein n=1 Tax=Mycotypha africana TaxID=64632 RepID=UPI0023002BE0|nr:uncharacterized protein BDF20DRAFT_873470 [Mycotypha africana]KAI8977185.1 hypothetical protein BDF20DRAFT_873470 [Mycotypha africana]